MKKYLKVKYLIPGVLVLALLIVIPILVSGNAKVEVVIDFNGGVVTNGESERIFSVKKGETLSQPEDISRLGYTLTGWRSDGIDYSFGNKVKKSTVIVAQWSPNKYLITFDKNGGKDGSLTVEATYDTILPSATAPQKTGHSFIGYFDLSDIQYYNSNMSSVKSYLLADKVTLYAKWSVNSYTATCEYLDLDEVVVPVVTNVVYGTSFDLGIPTKYGHNFNGWFIGNEKVTDTFGQSITEWMYTENMTLIASWSKNITQGLVYTDYNESEVFVSGYTGIDVFVLVPKEYLGKKVVGIGNLAFLNNWIINEIMLPRGLEFIEEGAFIGCYFLKSINIPESVTFIGKEAFNFCVRLNEVVLPSSLTIIRESTFAYCMSLTSIILPEGLGTIETFAFEQCSILEEITIPNSVMVIESKAFINCGLLTITVRDHLSEPIEWSDSWNDSNCPVIWGAQ